MPVRNPIQRALSESSVVQSNGASTSPSSEIKTSALAERLAERIARARSDQLPDAVKIGRDGYISAPVDDTSSWADLAEANKKVRYLLKGWIPYDMLSGLVGDSKAGKSMFLLWAVVRPIITGCDWFTGQLGAEQGYVVWCDTERRAAINLERATRWGLPVERIITPFTDKYKIFDMQDAEHIKRLMDVVCRYEAKVVIVDSFRGAHRGDENNSKMDAALKDLGSVCEQTHTAIPIIHHIKKTRIEGEEAGGEPTLHCARGSSAFLAAVACQLVIDIPEPRPNLKEAWRRVQVLGENLGVAPAPVGFRIHDDGLEFGPAPRRAETEKKGSERDKCKKWLDVRLPPRARCPAHLLIEEAESLGWSKTGTLQRAKTELGIVSDQKARPQEWVRDSGGSQPGYQERPGDNR
jgi:hypothetical protein